MLLIKGRSLFPNYDVQNNLNDIVWGIKKFMLLQLSLILVIGVNIRNAWHLAFLTLIRVFSYLYECLKSSISNYLDAPQSSYQHVLFSFSKEKYKYADNLGVNASNLILLILNMK